MWLVWAFLAGITVAAIREVIPAVRHWWNDSWDRAIAQVNAYERRDQ